MTNLLVPRFQHDCDECIFVGFLEVEGKLTDCYVCEHENGASVIARFSSRGADYASVPFMGKDADKEWLSRVPEWARTIREMRFGKAKR